MREQFQALGTEVRLAGDDGPVYHALLNPSDAGVVDLEHTRKAREALRLLEERDLGAIKACAGLSSTEARKQLMAALVGSNIIDEGFRF